MLLQGPVKIWRKQALLWGALFLCIFVIWNGYKSARLEPALLQYEAKFSIFYRNYKTFGLGARHLFPFYNFEQTNPPKGNYLSESPFLPLTMYAAARVFGDQPLTYRSIIVIINIFFFVLLSFFVGRRWGVRPALWTLFFAALSPYAFYYGYEQSYEQLCVLGMFSSVFLYFEWFQNRKDKYLILSLVAYAIGFSASYLAFFSAFSICIHYLLFEKRKSRVEFFKLSSFAWLTAGYVLFMSVLIQTTGLSVKAWFGRAVVRATGVSILELRSALLNYPLQFFGPLLTITATLYFLFKHKENKTREPVSDLMLLYALLIPGLLTVLIFKNLYVIHPYIVVFLLPFFAVSGALGVDHLLQRFRGTWSKRIIASLFALGFLVSSLSSPDIKELFHPSPPGVHGRLADLSRTIQNEIKPQDQLIVLGDEDQALKVTAFYILGIPTIDLNSDEELVQELTQRSNTLILCTSEKAINRIKTFEGAILIVQNQDLAFFRISERP